MEASSVQSVLPSQARPQTLEKSDVDASKVQRDTVDSRARLCFRALAMSLSAIVLLLISACLYVATLAFIDSLRLRVPAVFGAVPADLALIAKNTVGALGVDSGMHALVAVISALLIGDVVLAIGLIRATFSMRVNTDTPPPEKEGAPAGSGLPGVELLKAFADALATVTKGLHGR